VVGVGPRKVPNPQSFLIEIIGMSMINFPVLTIYDYLLLSSLFILAAILQSELEAIEKNPNIKTVEFIFELLKNVVFVAECRNAVVKVRMIGMIQWESWN